MSDTEARRLVMVDRQIRTFDVTDQDVLAAMLRIPREPFVGENNRALAYSDATLTLKGAQESRTLLAPMILARLLQHADIGPQSRVLDLAGATGYAAAVIARLAAKVVLLESDASFAQSARANFQSLGLSNALVVEGPLGQGNSANGPYDVIVIEGAVEAGLERIADGLAPGGRIMTIDVGGPVGRAVRIERPGQELASRVLFDAHAPTLAAFARGETFAF